MQNLNYLSNEVILDVIERNWYIWNNYNNRRINDIYQNLNEEEKDLLGLIPYLLSVNKSETPGYVDSDEKIP